VLVHRGDCPLGHGHEVRAVVADGPVLRCGVGERLAVDFGLLEPREVDANGAKVGPWGVAGQRRVLEVSGVLREQLRVLRSQFRALVRNADRVLRSHFGTLLLRMHILRSLAAPSLDVPRGEVSLPRAVGSDAVAPRAAAAFGCAGKPGRKQAQQPDYAAARKAARDAAFRASPEAAIWRGGCIIRARRVALTPR
jgi:hypothetical protein